MYHSGDDVGAIVADIGSFSTRIGHAGNDVPAAYFPSSVGVTTSESSSSISPSKMEVEGGGAEDSGPSETNYHFDLNYFRENMEVKHVMQDGLVKDWDMLERVWEHAIASYLKVDLKETPLLLSEKTYNSPSARQKMCELMFETFDVPALFLSKDAVLSCYAVGRTSGLVIDCGASGTVVSPVHDGWTEVKGISRGKVGGRYMDAFILQTLQQQHTLSKPLFRLNKTLDAAGEVVVTDKKGFSAGDGAALRVHPSYEAYMQLEMARDFKDSVCRMPPEPLTSEPDSRFLNIPTTPYVLPDGTLLETGLERFQPPELLVDPCPSFFAASSKVQETSKSSFLMDSQLSPLSPGALPGSFDSLPKLIVDSAFRCEPEVQAGLVANLIVTGGNSCFEGVGERIKSEVEKLIHPLAPSWKVKYLAAGQSERALCPWLGGSILASLGSFHDMWFSRAEYNEYGAALVNNKCP